MNHKSIREYVNKFALSFNSINEDKLEELIDKMIKIINTQKEVFIIGNGGSAANANHIAGDYLKTFSVAGLSFKISSLTESITYLTAVSNDEDFSEVY